MSVYCGDPDCEECQFTGVVPKGERTTNNKDLYIIILLLLVYNMLIFLLFLLVIEQC